MVQLSTQQEVDAGGKALHDVAADDTCDTHKGNTQSNTSVTTYEKATHATVGEHELGYRQQEMLHRGKVPVLQRQTTCRKQATGPACRKQASRQHLQETGTQTSLQEAGTQTSLHKAGQPRLQEQARRQAAAPALSILPCSRACRSVTS